MAEQSDASRFFQQAASVVVGVYKAVFRDGTVDAALRQGANELGQALKPFPDSIQVDEPGAVFNPMYSDIAQGRDRYAPAEPAERPSLPSPSQIAATKAEPNRAEPDHGQEQDRGV